MTMESLLVPISILCLTILLFIVVLKKWNQPSPIAYLMAGVVLGPQLTGVFKNTNEIRPVGEIGLLFLMFFLGLEIEIPEKKQALFRPVVAQAIKTVLIVAIFSFLG